MDNSYSAFLSFASPDRELVKQLSELFKEIGLDVYFAPEGLPKRGTEAWRTAILTALRNSKCIIPVLTLKSIHRAWVLYEIGAADMHELPILKAKTVGVSSAHLQAMPGTDSYAYSLGNRENLRDLVLKVCEISKGSEFRDNTEGMVDQIISTNEHAQKVISMSVLRKVFIGGSVPSDRKVLEQLTILDSNLKADKLLVELVNRITVQLLENGFQVSSCPDVSVVGITVAKTAFEWSKKKGKMLSDVYSVQGMLSLQGRLTEEDLVKALQHGFVNARKEYLKDHEFFIVVGGNQRAELECKAAKELGSVKLLPVTCVGGTAYKVSRDLSYNSISFMKNENKWSEHDLDALIESMQ